MAGRDTGYLDGIRALAAFWVLGAHCLIWGGYTGFIPDAKIAVAVFMVLSGYLMMLVAPDFRSPGAWRDFYLRRFFRIAPLYYLVLIALAVSPWVQQGYEAWRRMPAGSFYDPALAHFDQGNLALHFSFLFGLNPRTATSTLLPDWSLSLEMQFYAVFPLVWLAVRRWGAIWTSLSVAAICGPLWLTLRDSWPDPSLLPLQLPYFLVGVLAFEARQRLYLIVPAVLLGLFELPFLGWQTAIVPGVAVVIVALDRLRLAPIRGLFANPVARVGADVSYGVYLIHGFFIAACGFFHLGPWTLFAVVLPSTVCAAWAMHWLVERPSIALGRRLTPLILVSKHEVLPLTRRRRTSPVEGH